MSSHRSGQLSTPSGRPHRPQRSARFLLLRRCDRVHASRSDGGQLPATVSPGKRRVCRLLMQKKHEIIEEKITPQSSTQFTHSRLIIIIVPNFSNSGQPTNVRSLKSHVRLGSGHEQQLILIQETRLHPHFDNVSLDWNVALVILGQTLFFSEALRPVRLAPFVGDRRLPVVTDVVASGWGFECEQPLQRWHERWSFVFAQRFVQVTPEKCRVVHDSLPCLANYCPTFREESMACMEVINNAEDDGDGCDADVGAPLVQVHGDGEMMVLLGVRSFASEDGQLVAFVRVDLMREWLDEILYPQRRKLERQRKTTTTTSPQLPTIGEEGQHYYY